MSSQLWQDCRIAPQTRKAAKQRPERLRPPTAAIRQDKNRLLRLLLQTQRVQQHLKAVGHEAGGQYLPADEAPLTVTLNLAEEDRKMNLRRSFSNPLPSRCPRALSSSWFCCAPGEGHAVLCESSPLDTISESRSCHVAPDSTSSSHTGFLITLTKSPAMPYRKQRLPYLEEVDIINLALK